jgi:putative Holliday junction resolvase
VSGDLPRAKLPTPNAHPPASGTVLAFDFGEKRVGVAVADLAVGIAHPLQTLDIEDNHSRFAAIAALIAEWRPVRLIVGEPRHVDGGPHEIGRLARRFAQRLEGRFSLPVELVDETLSSHAAEQELRAQGLSHGRRGKLKAALDAGAAAGILSTWLTENSKKLRDTS